jgi:hypothetical protein
MRSSQIELLGSLLTEAFYDDPRVTYILPDEQKRRSVLSWFFTSVAIRTSRLCGEISTTANVDGAALWISPGVELTIGHAVRTEVLFRPFKLDRLSLARWINVNRCLETARLRQAGKHHWYLLALGAEPSTAGRAPFKALMAPVLERADWDLRSCYAESFQERDLPFYEQSGFQIAGAGRIPNGGPNFWTLVRPAMTRKNCDWVAGAHEMSRSHA